MSTHVFFFHTKLLFNIFLFIKILKFSRLIPSSSSRILNTNWIISWMIARLRTRKISFVLKTCACMCELRIAYGHGFSFIPLIFHVFFSLALISVSFVWKMLSERFSCSSINTDINWLPSRIIFTIGSFVYIIKKKVKMNFFSFYLSKKKSLNFFSK